MLIITQLLPVLIIFLIGYLSYRFNFLGDEAVSILSRILFYLVMPVTLFLDVAQAKLSVVFNLGFMGAYVLAALAVIAIVCIASIFLFKENPIKFVLNSMAAVHTNTAYLALPIFIMIFNNVQPVVAVILIQTCFTFLIILLLEVGQSKVTGGFYFVAACNVFWKVPILVGILLGLIFNLTHLTLPSVLLNTFGTMKASAAFIALYALGLSLAQPHNNADQQGLVSKLGFLVLVKSVLHPFLAFMVGYYIFSLSGFWLTALVLMAAMPSAKNLFIFGQQYPAAALKEASMIILLTTILSLISINIILYALGT